jgi:hypothetical protein
MHLARDWHPVIARLERLAPHSDSQYFLRTDTLRCFTPWGPRASLTEQTGLSNLLRIAAIVLRSSFLIALIAVVARVSFPQSEKIWTIYDEPRDAVRLLLGFVVSVSVVYHLFRLPKEAQGYRIWVSLGLILVPLTLATLFFIW